MNAAGTIAAALLRFAARRWPAEVRDEQVREWAAELHALRTDPGTGTARRAGAQLRFALSLATASPVEDEHGVPRGWREAPPNMSRSLRPMLVLVLFGVLAVGPVSGLIRAGCELVLRWLGVVRAGWLAGAGITSAGYLVALLVVTITAWWLGRYLPVGPAGTRWLGPAGSAAVAPVAFAVAFAVLVASEWSGNGATGPFLPAGVLAWVLLAATLAVAVVRLAVRGRRWLAAALAVIGTPLVVELATAAAALPVTLAGGAGPLAALAWGPAIVSGRAGSAGAGSWYGSPDASALFDATSVYPGYLLLLTGLALGYGLGAARPRPLGQRLARRWAASPALVPDAAQAPPIRVLPVAVAVAGLVGLLVGLLSWAYTLAVLTPAMPLVGHSAPMPGGDSELYMWVAELRWGGIALAALGLLLAAADRRGAPLAAVVQTVVLLTADGMLARAGAAGAAGLRTALAAAAVAAVLAWWVAGAPRRRGADALTTRRRLAGVAVTAACSGPILLAQGTAAVNHPFLPAGLAVVTGALPALLAVVAGYAAAAARPRRLTGSRLAALVGGSALLFGAWGGATGAGVPYELTAAGVLFSAPMIVMVVGVMRAGQPRRRPATAVWIALMLASPVVSALVVMLALTLSIIGAGILFAVAGTSWQADGLSLLPGAVLLAVPAGAVVARVLIHPAEPPAGQPALPMSPALPMGMAGRCLDRLRVGR